jgi:hypothetical protein
MEHADDADRATVGARLDGLEEFIDQPDLMHGVPPR